MSDELKPLSKKHKQVQDMYLSCFNQTAAYMSVYPKATYESARTSAAALFAIPNFSAHLEARLAQAHMSADEAIKRLSDMARGDIGQFMDRLGSLDIQAARDAGLTPLIKKIKQRTITKIGKKDDDDDTEIHDLEIELYSAKDAIDTILKVGGKLKDSEFTINVRLTDD
jgi:hypothetical protein